MSKYQYVPGGLLYHISVGAVVFNDTFEVCVHHLFRKDVPKRLQFLSGGLDDIYLPNAGDSGR